MIPRGIGKGGHPTEDQEADQDDEDGAEGHSSQPEKSTSDHGGRFETNKVRHREEDYRHNGGERS